MFHKLKQFNDMRKQANSLRAKLAQESTSIEHKGITIVMDGNQEVKSVTLPGDALTPGNKTTLETNVKDAINESVKKSQRMMATKLRESGDLKIPGLS